MAETWFRDEYEPVVEMLKEADLIGRGTETEAYMRVSHLRYLLLRTHEWNDDVIERLREELESPTWDEDTMVKAAQEGASLGAAVRRCVGALLAPRPRVAGLAPLAAVRLRPSSGSNRWRRLGVDPELGLLALLHLAGRVEPGHDPALLARHRHLAAAGVLGQLAQLLRTRSLESDSTVKWAYSSEPIDSSTSILALKVAPWSLGVADECGVLEVLRADAGDQRAASAWPTRSRTSWGRRTSPIGSFTRRPRPSRA